MQILGHLLEALFGPTESPAPLYTVRRAERGDRAGVITVVSGERNPRAADVAATAELAGHRCACGRVIHCWVAVGRLGEILGVLSAIDEGRQISLVDLVVEPPWRRLGVGGQLLAALAEFADQRRVPTITLVRGSDVQGLSWLCDRGFVPAKFVGGRQAIAPDAFPDEACTEGIALARPAPGGIAVRIAE